jgi:hypothetical protein
MVSWERLRSDLEGPLLLCPYSVIGQLPASAEVPSATP